MPLEVAITVDGHIYSQSAPRPEHLKMFSIILQGGKAESCITTSRQGGQHAYRGVENEVRRAAQKTNVHLLFLLTINQFSTDRDLVVVHENEVVFLH